MRLIQINNYAKTKTSCQKMNISNQTGIYYKQVPRSIFRFQVIFRLEFNGISTLDGYLMPNPVYS